MSLAVSIDIKFAKRSFENAKNCKIKFLPQNLKSFSNLKRAFWGRFDLVHLEASVLGAIIYTLYMISYTGSD